MRVFLILLAIFLALIGESVSLRIIKMTNRTLSNLPGFPRQGSSHKGDDKIVGGWYVKDMEKYPYMVSITIYLSHQCGGGLLSMRYVITACHCLAYIPEKEEGMGVQRDDITLDAYKIIAGTKNLDEFDEGVQIGRVKSIHIHPKCQNLKSVVYDMALAELRSPFRQTIYVKPLKMYTWNKKKFRKIFYRLFGTKDDDPSCTVAGWGETRRGEFGDGDAMGSDRLKAVKMYVMREKDCRRAWVTLMPEVFEGFNFWKYGQICTVAAKETSSDCSGDSGSPFVCRGHMIALVSFGTSACGTGSPSVYQTVSEMVDWIKRDFSGEIDTREPNEQYDDDDDDDYDYEDDAYDDEDAHLAERAIDNKKKFRSGTTKPTGSTPTKSSQQSTPESAILVLSGLFLRNSLEKMLGK